jgi:branched-chain amino acid transport system substrate-binding protein
VLKKSITARGVVAVLVGMGMLAVACGGSSSDGTSSSGPAKSASDSTTPAKGTPIVIGQVVSLTTATARSTQGQDAMDTWLQWTNDHGGINGHPVKLYTEDDKSDPAVGLAAVKDLVENKHVVALVGDAAGSTEQTWASYVLEKRIPVIGDQYIDALWFTNPMFYPLGATVITQIWGQLKAAQVAGAKKVASFLCTEVAACAQAQPIIAADAKSVGLDLVVNALASGTQASYTAECLAAKKAGADAVDNQVNPTLLPRDCGRQDYHPLFLTADMAPNAETIKGSPDAGNAAGATPEFPCLKPDIPAAKDFYAAIKKYHPEWWIGGSKHDQFASVNCEAWIAGEGFKLAITRAAVDATATVTNEDVIKGLATFKDEKIAGLTPPVTLSDGTKPNPMQKCVFLYRWKGVKSFDAMPADASPTCMP